MPLSWPLQMATQSLSLAMKVTFGSVDFSLSHFIGPVVYIDPPFAAVAVRSSPIDSERALLLPLPAWKLPRIPSNTSCGVEFAWLGCGRALLRRDKLPRSKRSDRKVKEAIACVSVVLRIS